MKKISVIIFTLLCASIQTILNSVPVQSGPIASGDIPWNFEISNKAKAIPIFVTLKNNNGVILQEKKVENGGKLRAFLDDQILISRPMLIIRHGYTSEKFVASFSNLCTKRGRNGNCPDTVFLTFECPTTFFDSASLRPQRGTVGGLSGFSESGISLRNNIHPNQIKRY